ncbi:radical SAM protein [Pseudothermotoga elfii]
MRPIYEKMNPGEIKRRADILKRRMKKCNLCPRKCGVNRLNNEIGACKTGYGVFVSSYGPHFGEESFLVGNGGSGTIFFSGCNMTCVYCQNWQISQSVKEKKISVEKLANIMIELQKMNCHNVNLVSPTHQIAFIVEAVSIAVEKGLKIPIVYNCSGYESLYTLELLEGLIDIYMPDFKYGEDSIALKYSGIKNYVAHTFSALKEMHRQVGALKIENNLAVRGVFVRHLVLPERLTAPEKIFQLISSISRDIPVNIMSQYYPAYKAHHYPELSRKIHVEEYNEVFQMAKDFGLKIIA